MHFFGQKIKLMHSPKNKFKLMYYFENNHWSWCGATPRSAPFATAVCVIS